MPGKLAELTEEFRTVALQRQGALDALLPPTAFVVVNAAWGLLPAAIAALGLAGVIALWRLARRQPTRYALSGLALGAVAAGSALILGRAEGYFLPGIASSLLTALVALGSAIARRPLVAWTSALARGWPLEWYWHARVRPAYTEVTLFWAAYYALEAAAQAALYARGDARALALFQTLSGWPALIALLAVSYLYGLRRLRALAGPSVDEFRAGSPPPWAGQRRGF